MTFDPSTLTLHPGLLAVSTVLTGALTIIGVAWMALGLFNLRNWERGDFRLFITVLLVSASTLTLMLFAQGANDADRDRGAENLQSAIADRYGVELSGDGMSFLLGGRTHMHQWDLHAGKGDQQYWTATDEPVELVIDGERQLMRFAWLGDQWIVEDADGEELPVIGEAETGADG